MSLRLAEGMSAYPTEAVHLHHLWTPPGMQGESFRIKWRVRWGADICPATDAAVHLPRARMGVREPGPNQSRVLEGTRCKTGFLVPSLDPLRHTSPSDRLTPPTTPRSRASLRRRDRSSVGPSLGQQRP